LKTGKIRNMGRFTVTRKRRRLLFVLSILVPICIWFFVFMILPIFSVVFYSFTNANMAFSDWKFVGFEQYIKMFTEDTLFPIAVWNTVKSVLIIVPLTVVLSVTLALGINSIKSKLNKFFTFVYFLPSIISMVAICMVWKWLYHQQYGIINAVLGFFGFLPQQFLNSGGQALFCLCVIQVWALIGYYAVILVAAIRGIDLSLYEAAEVDGANGWRKTFHITLPLIRQNVFFVCIMATTQAFMIFTPVKVLTDGMPGTSTYVLMLHIMNRGINNNDIAYASAMSLVLMGIILVFSLFQRLITREKKELA
jgi:multiple sugar transport system permease protein